MEPPLIPHIIKQTQSNKLTIQLIQKQEKYYQLTNQLQICQTINQTIKRVEEQQKRAFNQIKKNKNREQIKTTAIWNENHITDNMLEISDKLDQHMKNSLYIPSSFPAPLQLPMPKYINFDSYDDELDTFMEAFNQQQLQVDLLTQNLKEKVAQVTEASSVSNINTKYIKNKQIFQTGGCEVQFESRTLRSEIFQKTQTINNFYNRNKLKTIRQKTNKSSSGQEKQNIFPPISTPAGQTSKQIFNVSMINYVKKLKRMRMYGDHLMTKNRQNGLFINQLMIKIHKKDAYSHLHLLYKPEKDLDAENDNKQNKDHILEFVPPKKIPKLQLNNLTKKFDYLKNLNVQKL